MVLLEWFFFFAELTRCFWLTRLMSYSGNFSSASATGTNPPHCVSMCHLSTSPVHPLPFHLDDIILGFQMFLSVRFPSCSWPFIRSPARMLWFLLGFARRKQSSSLTVITTFLTQQGTPLQSWQLFLRGGRHGPSSCQWTERVKSPLRLGGRSPCELSDVTRSAVLDTQRAGHTRDLQRPHECQLDHGYIMELIHSSVGQCPQVGASRALRVSTLSSESSVCSVSWLYLVSLEPQVLIWSVSLGLTCPSLQSLLGLLGLHCYSGRCPQRPGSKSGGCLPSSRVSTGPSECSVCSVS